MLTVGTAYRCNTCQTEVEVVNAGNDSASQLICCETTMEKLKDFDELWEAEAYDAMDDDWN